MHCSTSVLSDAAAKLSTLKLAPLSGRGSESATVRDKGEENYPAIIPIPSLSLPLPLSLACALTVTCSLSNGRNCPLLTEFRAGRQFRRGRPVARPETPDGMEGGGSRKRTVQWWPNQRPRQRDERDPSPDPRREEKCLPFTPSLAHKANLSYELYWSLSVIRQL